MRRIILIGDPHIGRSMALGSLAEATVYLLEDIDRYLEEEIFLNSSLLIKEHAIHNYPPVAKVTNSFKKENRYIRKHHQIKRFKQR
jgi:hypothetical protein